MKKANRTLVFDTGVLYLYFVGDNNVKQIFHEIKQGLCDGFTLEANTAELYYKTCENFGRDVALIRYKSVRQSSLVVTSPDEGLSLNAGQIKAAYGNKLSLVDAYVISLTRRVRGILYTTDARIHDLKIVPTKLLKVK